MTYKGKYLQAIDFCSWPEKKKKALLLGLYAAIYFINYNFEDAYGQICWPENCECKSN